MNTKKSILTSALILGLSHGLQALADDAKAPSASEKLTSREDCYHL